jgi:arsenite-transporting ATPase
LAVLETARLITNLDKFGIKVRQMVINNVVESDGCKFCREKRKEQDRYINLIRRKFNGLKATMVPACSHEIKGLTTLADFKKQLFN